MSKRAACSLYPGFADFNETQHGRLHAHPTSLSGRDRAPHGLPYSVLTDSSIPTLIYNIHQRPTSYHKCCLAWCRLSASILLVSLLSNRMVQDWLLEHDHAVGPIKLWVGRRGVPRKAFPTICTLYLRLVFDCIPQFRILRRQCTLQYQLTLTSGVSGHMAREVVFPCEDILAAIVWL